jgi:outer membrane protein
MFMTTIRCGICAAILLLIATGTGRAQDSPKQYTLQECITIGLKSNPDLARSRGEIDRAAAQRTQAFGAFLPTVSGSASWTRTDQKQWAMRADVGALQTQESFSYTLGADLQLFNGLANINTADRSVLGFQASEKSVQRREQDVIYSVSAGYINALRLKQLVTVNASTLERSRKQLDRVRELNAVGSVPLADVYRQQVQVGRDELLLLQSENTFRNALVDLQTLIGLDPRQPMDLSGTDIPSRVDSVEVARTRAELPTVDALMAEALRLRPDLAQARLQLQSAAKSVAVARGGYWPRLSAFAQYNWSNTLFQWALLTDNTFGRFSYGLGLSIPIFSNFQVSTAVQSAQIDERNAQTTLMELERNVTAALQKASNELTAAEKNLEISRRTLFSAQEDHRIANERYSLGAGTLLDLIVANSNLTAAQSDVINGTFNYLIVLRQVDYQLGRITY